MSTICLERSLRLPARRSLGFTMVSLLFILVALAVLGSALAAIATRQHLGAASDLASARAAQAARAGLEWAAFQLLRQPAPPAAAPACFADTSLSALAGLADYAVTVHCSRTPASGTLSDGSTTLVFYQVVANACNLPSAGACPASGTPQPTYVERQLSWTLVR